MNEEFDRKAYKALGVDDNEKLDEKIISDLDEIKRGYRADEKLKYIEKANWTKKCLVISKLNTLKTKN